MISGSSIPGSGRSRGGRNDNPLQYFCLGNPKDKDVWCATVSAVAKGPTGRLTAPASLVPGPPAQLHQSDRPCVSNKLQGEANTAGGGTLLCEARILSPAQKRKRGSDTRHSVFRGDRQGPDQRQRGERGATARSARSQAAKSNGGAGGGPLTPPLHLGASFRLLRLRPLPAPRAPPPPLRIPGL